MPRFASLFVPFKDIGDVSAAPKYIRRHGDHLAKYLTWRAHAMAFHLFIWILLMFLQCYLDIKTLQRARGVAANPDSKMEAFIMTRHMKFIAWANTITAFVFTAVNAVAYVMFIKAYLNREKKFKQSVNTTRHVYYMYFALPLVLYLLIPYGYLVNQAAVEEDICTLVLWALKSPGEFTSGLIEFIVRTFGPASLQEWSTSPLPTAYNETMNWSGRLWCRQQTASSGGSWVQVLFGPNPSNPRALAGQLAVSGLAPRMVNALEVMTGAKCIKARSLSRPMAFFEVDDGNATHFGSRLAHPAWHQALVEIDAFMGANRLGDHSFKSDMFPAAGLGVDRLQSKVCSFARWLSVMADLARTSPFVIASICGVYSAFLSFFRLFPTCTSGISGFKMGVLSVKQLTPQNSLPGYLLIIGTCMFLPGMVINYVLLGQLAGNAFFSIALTSWLAGACVDMDIGAICTETNKGYDKLQKEMQPKEYKQRVCLITCLVGLILACVQFLMFSFTRTAVGKGLEKLFKLDALSVTYAIFAFVMNKNFTRLVFTDFIMASMFDVQDDSLRIPGKDERNSKVELLKEWYALTAQDKKLARLSSSEFQVEDSDSGGGYQDDADSDDEDDQSAFIPRPPPSAADVGRQDEDEED
mmetsp:Transcript_43516/g.100157  ORF Transcript_43516/g.100157 Transcript_43516/m.100157 type:complete len:639 (-) Transcript_43516:80-1996(-)